MSGNDARLAAYLYYVAWSEEELAYERAGLKLFVCARQMGIGISFRARSEPLFESAAIPVADIRCRR